MKKTLLFLFGLFFIVMTASAGGGWADCAVNLTKDGGASYLYSLGNETWASGDWILNDSFDGYNFGTPSSLVLNGGVGNAWTDDTPGYTATSFVMYYRVYKSTSTPGSWSQIALDNVNPQNGLNYVFDKTTAGIDVLALATDAGTYILEVAMSKNQFYAGGNWNSMIPGGQAVAYDPSNSGYKATFTKSASIATLTVTGISPSSGTTAGGTSVVITGTNFTGTTAVKFGSANAIGFTVNSATQITATAPARSVGTVDITVTTAGGTSATSSADQFTYVAAPAATTNAATSISSAGATLNGSINAKNGSTTVTFEYGLTTSYGTTVTADQSPVTGSAATPVSKAITGLAAGVTYHYRVVGVNAGGRTNGLDKSFTTPLFAGNGTPEDPYPIATLADLKWVSEHSDIWNGSFVQTADIDASTTSTWNAGKGFSPIGDVTTKFTGSYNGQYHTITGLTINRPDINDYNIGLFGVTSSATLKNIGLPDCSIIGGYNVGALVGYMGYNSIRTSSISDCYCTGEVSGTSYVGGLVGANQTSGITNSYSTCKVTALTDAAGLLALNLNSTIANCFYDKNTSGQTDNTGKGTPKTTVEMKTQSTFTGWDFAGETANGTADIWAISSTLNNGYPCFMSQITSPVAPTVTTQAVTAIATTTATGNGDITGLGVPNPGSHGICWGASVNPTIIDNTVVNKGVVSATGAFSAPITGLTPNTLYHVRAYATNSTGTVYGNDVSFTTKMPTVTSATTNAATSVTSTGATLNGSINANNASTAVTFEYGLTTSYGNTVTADQSPVTGTSATVVSYTLTGLTPNTTYHYRVIGLNSEGTTNGGDMTFSTTDIAPNISYVTPQIYTVGTPIAALTPTNTGGAVVAISSPQVSTLAGSGVSGSADGLGTAASFNIPVFLAPDAAGNLYVSDLVNNMIRKITPAGSVSTLADVSAGFNEPAGIAVDPSGNVYVAENENHRIRKITPAGVVSTVAGSDSGERGNTNGSGAAARFNAPAGLTLDAAGNLYVSDNGNKQIRKITPAGEVSTFAGSGIFGSTDGNGTSASFKSPIGIVIDASGNLYVADSRSNLIRKISPTGDVSTFAGSGAEGSTNGNGTLASFNAPEGIAIDASGNLYIADSENNLIRKINHAGDVTTLAGNGSLGADNGAAETASFIQPYGVALDASGNLYVADTYNNLIRKITQSAYTITPALPAGLSFDGATGTISGTPTAASAATTYTVTTANNGGSSTTTISIAVKNPQTISFGTLASKTYGDATFDLAATSTSGLAVSYSSDNTAVATVSGNTVTIVGAGTANITATQAGDATNFAAANVTQQLSVSKKALTVMAVADTKIYDGTTASTAVPTVGAQASGDTINVAPTQAFDNATVGTTHVLTASGLTVKKGSANVTGNYDISYVSSTGVINKRALTITDPTVVTSKTVDGNTTAVVSSSGTLQNVLSSDLNNVAVTAAANYDNATAGINKTITVVYTLSGSASGNYTAPVNFVITDAKIVDISSGVDAPTVSDAEAVTAYPTQVAMGLSCQVRVSGLTDSDLQGTTLSVYNTQGICVYHSTKVGLTNSIALPPVQGMYLGRAITAKGKEFQFKVIVTR